LPEVVVRAVLFDAAGTLIALREPVGETYARVARQYGVGISAWRLGEAFGRILRRTPPLVAHGSEAEIAHQERAWWRRVVRGTFRAADSAEAERFEDFEACFDALFRRFAEADSWRATEGAHAALRALRAAGAATGVVSNFDHRLRPILRDLGLLDWLDVVVLPSDAGAAKPDPAIFRVALDRLGTDAAAAAFVGDDPDEDLAAARRCGLRAIDVGQLATLAELPARLATPDTPPVEDPGE
jgi:putative hydrolase of the HAD superfamily